MQVKLYHSLQQHKKSISCEISKNTVSTTEAACQAKCGVPVPNAEKTVPIPATVRLPSTSTPAYGIAIIAEKEVMCPTKMKSGNEKKKNVVPNRNAR